MQQSWHGMDFRVLSATLSAAPAPETLRSGLSRIRFHDLLTPRKLIVILACAMLKPASAEPEALAVDWGASIRLRHESKQDFDFIDASQTYFLSQTRLHFNVQTRGGNRFSVELQDARVSGESKTQAPPIHDDATPNIFADRLDLHQAYWRHDAGRAEITIGRQKLNFGDRRLVASLEWVNTARVHDGIRLSMGDSERRRVDVFATALVAVDPDDFNDQADADHRYLDSLFHGVIVADRVTLSTGQLQYWYFYRANDNFADRTRTIGLRYASESGRWRPDLQAAYQFGDFGGEDHEAWMAHIGVGRLLPRGRLDVSYSHATGDRNPQDLEHQTFDNLFPLNHPYYGHMDLFSLQNLKNLEIAYQRSLPADAMLRVGVNEFWLPQEDSDAWYNAGLVPTRLADRDVSSRVGREIDLTLQVPFLGNRLQLAAGLSVFVGGSYLSDQSLTENARFFFASVTYAVL